MVSALPLVCLKQSEVTPSSVQTRLNTQAWDKRHIRIFQIRSEVVLDGWHMQDRLGVFLSVVSEMGARQHLAPLGTITGMDEKPLSFLLSLFF